MIVAGAAVAVIVAGAAVAVIVAGAAGDSAAAAGVRALVCF